MTRIWQSPLHVSPVHQAECESACMKQPPVFVHLQDILEAIPASGWPEKRGAIRFALECVPGFYAQAVPFQTPPSNCGTGMPGGAMRGTARS